MRYASGYLLPNNDMSKPNSLNLFVAGQTAEQVEPLEPEMCCGRLGKNGSC